MAVDDYIKALEDRGAPDVRTARYDLDAHVLPAPGEIAVSAFRRPRISAWRAAIASSRRRAHRKDASAHGKVRTPQGFDALELAGIAEKPESRLFMLGMPVNT